MRASDRAAWRLADMNELLSLAGVDKRGLVEREDLEGLCESCLRDAADGSLLRRAARAPSAPFLQSRYGGEGGGGEAGAASKAGSKGAALGRLRWEGRLCLGAVCH